MTNFEKFKERLYVAKLMDIVLSVGLQCEICPMNAVCEEVCEPKHKCTDKILTWLKEETV